MRSQVLEGDLLPAALGDLHRVRQILRHRIGQGDLAALNHVRKEQGGENLRNRADLEKRVAIESRLAIRNGTASGGLDHTDDEVDALLLRIDALDEDLTNLGIADDLRGCDTREECDCENQSDAFHAVSFWRSSSSICRWYLWAIHRFRGMAAIPRMRNVIVSYRIMRATSGCSCANPRKNRSPLGMKRSSRDQNVRP